MVWTTSAVCTILRSLNLLGDFQQAACRHALVVNIMAFFALLPLLPPFPIFVVPELLTNLVLLLVLLVSSDSIGVA